MSKPFRGPENFGSHIGRAEVADEVVGPNFTELWISVDPNGNHAAILGRVQAVVDGYPGLYKDVQTYLKERIKEVLTGAGATVVVRIFGPAASPRTRRPRSPTRPRAIPAATATGRHNPPPAPAPMVPSPSTPTRADKAEFILRSGSA